MTKFSSQYGPWATAIAVVLLAPGCGGRTNGDDPDNVSPDGSTDDTPPPTCTEICRHVVDSCFPGGATTQCTKDCETMRSDYVGCKELNTFLRCNLTARVKCTDQAIIDDCYDERDALSRCK